MANNKEKVKLQQQAFALEQRLTAKQDLKQLEDKVAQGRDVTMKMASVFADILLK